MRTPGCCRHCTGNCASLGGWHRASDSDGIFRSDWAGGYCPDCAEAGRIATQCATWADGAGAAATLYRDCSIMEVAEYAQGYADACRSVARIAAAPDSQPPEPLAREGPQPAP